MRSGLIAALAAAHRGGSAPPVLDAADSNDEGDIDFSDGVAILELLFQGGRTGLPPTYSAPGPDPTPDGLAGT